MNLKRERGVILIAIFVDSLSIGRLQILAVFCLKFINLSSDNKALHLLYTIYFRILCSKSRGCNRLLKRYTGKWRIVGGCSIIFLLQNIINFTTQFTNHFFFFLYFFIMDFFLKYIICIGTRYQNLTFIQLFSLYLLLN